MRNPSCRGGPVCANYSCKEKRNQLRTDRHPGESLFFRRQDNRAADSDQRCSQPTTTALSFRYGAQKGLGPKRTQPQPRGGGAPKRNPWEPRDKGVRFPGVPNPLIRSPLFRRAWGNLRMPLWTTTTRPDSLALPKGDRLHQWSFLRLFVAAVSSLSVCRILLCFSFLFY